jgi:hypothetical protein
MTAGIGLTHDRSTAVRYSWIVLGYLLVAYWVTQRLLVDWVSSADVNFFLVQPMIWLGLAVLALHGWRRLSWALPLSRSWIGVAVSIGIVHVAVLVVSGLIAGMASVRDQFDWLVYLENTWYVGTLLIGIETARTYLFHVWVVKRPTVAWTATALLFFVVATPYAQFDALRSGEHAIEIVGGSLIPALAISIVATWFAEQGGMWASLAYRAPILAFLWYSMVLPDLHWSTTLAVGVLAPVIAWNLAGPLAAAFDAPRRAGVAAS